MLTPVEYFVTCLANFQSLILAYKFKIVGIAIGGDVFPGSTLSDHILRFNNIPQVVFIPCRICSSSGS